MKNGLLITLLSLFSISSFANKTEPFVSKTYTLGSFALATKTTTATLICSENEYPGVRRAIANLQTDLAHVTDKRPELFVDKAAPIAVIIGTIGHSNIIDQLIKSNKINVSGIAGKWESTLIEVVKKPMPGIDSAIIIAGSDKRGTIYGIYEVSYQSGVSPWYYWADVPVKKSENLFIKGGRYVISSPAVKYRGIFLNDEAPALSGWSKKEFGGFNHKFYEKVFDLILRLKGNYLWPAMWGNAFTADDALNPVLADEYGVVIGTSHHEPLTRAHDEWRRYKGGKWNYDQNPEQLKEFWESGLKRVADKEQIITIGMRGDGDAPMSESTATALLERIVKDQRQIIEKVTKKPASATPQIWALYKEVQEYYDQGMRVPDDVTLLLADDNWGNIRKLPKLNELPRRGGYGIYYHFDYVGGPRNYKWINTNPIQKIWEQMHLAYQYQANQIWIVNVGDLKPMEFPIEFFLDYAWAPDAIPAENLLAYTINWASKQFDSRFAVSIAELIDLCSKYNGRIKPELLTSSTYSLVNYNEFENVISDFDTLYAKGQYVGSQLPLNQKDAYYQLVLHPIEASRNLYHLYYALAKNKRYATQKRASTNSFAKIADSLFKRDAEISHYYNRVMAGGKWNHMMDQTHIGYTSWQQPDSNIMPKTYNLQDVDLPKYRWGVSLPGSDSAWTVSSKVNKSLSFDFYSNHPAAFEIFNTRKDKFAYQITSPKYVLVKQGKGEISEEQRIELNIDWAKAPSGETKTEILVSGPNDSKIIIPLVVDNRRFVASNITGFVAHDGVISMEAPNYSRAINNRPIYWKTIPNYGKTLGGVTAMPVTQAPIQVDTNTAHLEYDIFLKEPGSFDLHTYVSPTIDFANNGGLKFGISVNDGPIAIVNISADFKTDRQWEKSVAHNIKIFKTTLKFDRTGEHQIKYWLVSPGVVLQKLVLDLGGLKPSYLGPPETFVP